MRLAWDKSVINKKNLQVEKKAYPFWIFILIGFFGNVLFKFFWKKLIGSQWYLRFFEIINRKL